LLLSFSQCLPEKAAEGQRSTSAKAYLLEVQDWNRPVLKVSVNRLDVWRTIQFFYANIGKDGRIFIPELVLAFFQDEKSSLAGSIFEATLEPA